MTVSLAAAVPAAPIAAPTRSRAPGASAMYPTLLPASNGPKPDVPASGPGYDDGFNTFPSNPVKAMPGDPPGTGSTVKIMSIALFPPPTPLAQNPAWQAVNKALNADVAVRRRDPGRLPRQAGHGHGRQRHAGHAVHLRARAARRARSPPPTGCPSSCNHKAADLTPYLAGDAAKDYPNLAAIPTQAWKNAGCAYQGHLYLVPIHRYLPGQMFVKNVERLGCGARPELRPQERRRFQTRAAGADQAAAGLLRHRRRAGLGHAPGHVRRPSSARRMAGGWIRAASWSKTSRRRSSRTRRRTRATCLPRACSIPDSLSMASNVIARTQFYARQVRHPSRSDQRLAGCLAARAAGVAAVRRAAAAAVPGARRRQDCSTS